MKCDYCANPALSELEKSTERKAGWLGVDFYVAICKSCFDKEKANI